MTTQQNTQEAYLNSFNQDLSQWKSNLQFIEMELSFIKRLLNSYFFEPTTPNLFENLSQFQTEIENIGNQVLLFNSKMLQHRNKIGGILECMHTSCDLKYIQDHKTLELAYSKLSENFQIFKTHVFEYTGGILKRKKKSFQS